MSGVTYSADAIADALGLHRPTPEQRAVIEAPLTNALVIAGAGSGKTETMAARVVWLVANGWVEPGQILGLTFTRKAASELGHRIGTRLRSLRRHGPGAGADATDATDPSDAEEQEETPTVSTYHGYAGALVGEHGLLLGLEPDLRVLSEASAWQVAHDLVHRWTGDMGAFTGATSSAVRAVVGLSGELGEHLRDPGEVRDWVRDLAGTLSGLPQGTSRATKPPEVIGYLEGLGQVLEMVEAYRLAKAERGAIDFGDQVAIAARLARDVPRVAAQERSRYRVVLLDEFQDTSEAQLVLLSALFGPDATERGADPVSVTAVGDPHQAIYGWRGASAGALERFPTRFADVDEQGRRSAATVHSLATSFRNHRPVLHAANALAAPLRERALVPVQPLQPLTGADAGGVEVARLETQPDEVEFVADWVQRRRAAPRPGEAVPSVAVLCRTRAQIQPLVTAMRDRGLAVQVVGLGGLLGTPLVRDLVAALAVADDPTRGPEVMRLLTGTVCRLGAADLDGVHAWLEHRRREESERHPDSPTPFDPSGQLQLGEVLDHLPPPGWVDPRSGNRRVGDSALARLRGLAGALQRVRSLASAPLVDVVRVAEQALGLDIEAASEPTSDPAWSRADLDAFSDVAAGYARSADRPGLGAFVAWLDAAEDRERGLDRPDLPVAGVAGDAVQVLTVHAAKGLEWDAVAVPGLGERTFPSHQSGGPPRLGPDGEFLAPDVNGAGWLTGYASLPYPLRGDHDSLPELDLHGCADLTEVRAADKPFRQAVGAHTVQEERRLAYVAMTRARTHLLLSAHLWADGAARVRATSRFLLEVKGLEPAVTVAAWCPPPDDLLEATNPLLDAAHTPPWPVDRSVVRDRYRDAVAAVLSDPALAPETTPLTLRDAADLVARAAADGAGTPVAALGRDLADLLREAAQRTEARDDPARVVPRHLSTSDVVALAADRDRVLAQWRRPMPQPPARAARMGTSFHAWVERHYQNAALLEPEEIALLDGPDPVDPLSDDPSDPVARMRAHFLASPWAAVEPRAIEVPVETHIGGRIIRGRIDAVFADGPDLGGRVGDLVVVDWKSGRPPTGETARVRALQLAAYRVAYARLVGVPVETVRGAFFHAQTGRTDRPDLPGEEDLAALLGEWLPG